MPGRAGHSSSAVLGSAARAARTVLAGRGTAAAGCGARVRCSVAVGSRVQHPPAPVSDPKIIHTKNLVVEIEI